MCSRFANLYVLSTWGRHMVYMGSPYIFYIYMIKCGWLGRSSDSFSPVPTIINGGDWGCIVHDLQTVIVLVLLAFNLIPQRSHHSLTLTGPLIKDSATATLSPWNGTRAIK